MPSLDMLAPVKISVTWKVAHTGDSLKREGNVRSTHLIIDMLLFAFPAYLKSLKDMRKPGGPQERNA